MGDCISTKRVICYIQENGIVRNDKGVVIGRLSEFKYDGLVESEYPEYMKIVTNTLKKDEEYYYSWQSNIAVPIQDRLPDVENIHEISNLCAKDFLDRLTK